MASQTELEKYKRKEESYRTRLLHLHSMGKVTASELGEAWPGGCGGARGCGGLAGRGKADRAGGRGVPRRRRRRARELDPFVAPVLSVPIATVKGKERREG